MTSAPPHLLAIGERVDQRLERDLTAEIERWSGLDALLVDPVSEVHRLVSSGGKRLRPAFCHWGFIAAGGDVTRAEDIDGSVVGAGAAIELTHASALFHDDVLDDADSRRGAETTHRRFERSHSDQGWDGESRRFGEGIAILVGDIAAVLADRYLVDAHPRAFAMWNELRIELNIGQLLDITGSVQGDRRIELADRICRYKSGKYTVERPLHLGALLAGTSDVDEVMSRLSAYGLPLGDAFQMRDDVMGAFGDTSMTGKPVGGDLREGKPTPLLARAIASATTAQAKILGMVGSIDLSDEQVADIQQTIVDVGALDELESLIASNVASAIQAIESPAIAEAAQQPLIELAEFITNRLS